MKTVEIECEGSSKLALHEMVPLQGTLKILSDENYNRLKKQISEEGFSFPIAIWESPDDCLFYIIDGHQRYHTLQKMKDEGWSVPLIPVVFVKAKSLDKAKNKLLAAASQYGSMNEKGFIEFLGSDVDFESIVANFNFPGMDMDSVLKKLDFTKNDVSIVSEHEREISEGHEENNANQVRMVQLFLDSTNHAEFMRMVLYLQEKYNTVNLTDTVLEVVRADFRSGKDL